MDPARIAPFTAADSDWLIARHAELYARDEGFDASFGQLVGQIVTAFLADHDPEREAGWIAWSGARRLGSILVVEEAPQVAKLRLVLLEPEARGSGLGQRLLDTAMGFARAAGFTVMRLWTHESHVAACRMYARNGFALTRSEAKRSFGQDVVEQSWERPL